MPWGVWKWRPVGQAAIRDLHSDDARSRVRALEEVAAWRHPDDGILENVVALLDDRIREVRLAAAGAAARLRIEKARTKLVDMLDREDSEIVGVAAHALAAIGGPQVRGILEGLLDREEGTVRCEAAVSLAELMGSEAGPILVRRFDDEDPYVRWGAIAAVGDVDYRDAIEQVAARLDDPHEEVRFEAAYTLARFGDSRGLEILGGYVTHKVRAYMCCEVLGRLGDPRAVPFLRKAWKSWRVHPIVRLRAAASLAMLDVADARRDLLKKALSGRMAHRQVALDLLGDVGGGDAVGLLEQAVREGRFASVAVESLTRLHDDRARACLKRLQGAAGLDAEARNLVRRALDEIASSAPQD